MSFSAFLPKIPKGQTNQYLGKSLKPITVHFTKLLILPIYIE